MQGYGHNSAINNYQHTSAYRHASTPASRHGHAANPDAAVHKGAGRQHCSTAAEGNAEECAYPSNLLQH